MLLIPFIGISVLATYLLRHTSLFIPALINVVLNLWSLGVQQHYAGTPVSSNYERVIGAVSMLTSALSLILLVTAFFVG